jgi:hypothetical protein
MSYDRNVYVGWYAEFTPTADKVQVALVAERQCSTASSHKLPSSGGFCSKCGSKIVIVDVPKFKSISPARHFIDETDPVEIEHATIGRATAADIEALQSSYAIFTEFMPAQQKKKEFILAPGYVKLRDVDREDSQIKPISVQSPPQDDWVKLLVKIFGCTDLKVEYGVIIEVI